MHPSQPEQSRQAAEAAQSSLSEPQPFLELVDSLEVNSGGRPLDGSGRVKCLRAFIESPRGFEIIVDRAIEEARSNPIGLLLWMVDRDHHTKAERAAIRNGADHVDEGIEFGC